MTKNSRGLIITLIVLLSIIALLMCAILVFFISGNTNVIPNLRNEVFYNESYNADDVADIIINSDAGDITIKNSTDGQITVIANGNNADSFTVENKNGVLNIRSVKGKAYSRIRQGGIFRNSFYGADIELYIPQNMNSVTINSAFGDIDIPDRLNTSLKVESNFGDIKADYLSGSFELQCDMGDIEIETIDISKNSKATTNMGDVEIDNTNSVNIVGETSLGECSINNSNPDSPVTLTVASDLGDVKINR